MSSAKLAVVWSMGALVACAAPQPAKAPTEPQVRALRFRQLVSEGAMDFMHGGGQWCDCVFLPDAGVVCTLQHELELTKSKAFVEEVPRLQARRASLDEELACRPQESPVGKQAPEEIEVSAAFAREAIALAELTERQRALSAELGARYDLGAPMRPPIARDF
jgi:hypothetical protein